MTKSIDRWEYRAVLDLLRTVRLEAGLSQATLSAMHGHPQPWASGVERGLIRLDLLQVHSWVASCGADFIEFAARFQKRLDALPRKKRSQVGGKSGTKRLKRETLKTFKKGKTTGPSSP